MSEHISYDRMNAALDGALTSAELDGVRRHVDGCATCRDEYARLSETVTALRTLPKSAAPPSELWSGIEARISRSEQTRSGADEAADTDDAVEVVSIADRRRESVEVTKTRIGLTWVQLAAAAALVAAVSAATMWMALDGGAAQSGVPIEMASDEPGGAAARAVALQGTPYAEAADRLEQIIEEGRGLLDPSTLLTIEESLRTVDAAIAEVEEALREDPNSDLLLRLLVNQQRTKLGVLQRAADAVQAQT